MMRSMDAKSAAVFVMGQLDVEFRESYVYRAFTESNNVNEEDVPIDYSKPIFWTMDFNYDPQCSVVCQEIEEEDGNFHVRVVDELILWNALPEHAAEEFSKRYEEYKKTEFPVYIYGDPAGLWGTGDGLVPSYFQKVRNVLIKNGFQVKVMMKRPDPDADTKFREKVKIPVGERIEAVNAMLCNAEDPPRIRLKVNPKCKNLIMSLEGLMFTEDGKSIDKKVDKNAGRSTNKHEPQLMTHPTDALGYYIYKRFPVFKNKRGIVTFFQIPGQSVVEIHENGKVLSKQRTEDEAEWIRTKKEERRKRREERKQQREQKKTNNLKNWLLDMGLWGGSDIF